MSSKKSIFKKQLSGKSISASEKAKIISPRNPFCQAASSGQLFSGSGIHVDKRKNAKNGIVKHKTRNYGF